MVDMSPAWFKTSPPFLSGIRTCSKLDMHRRAHFRHGIKNAGWICYTTDSWFINCRAVLDLLVCVHVRSFSVITFFGYKYLIPGTGSLFRCITSKPCVGSFRVGFPLVRTFHFLRFLSIDLPKVVPAECNVLPDTAIFKVGVFRSWRTSCAFEVISLVTLPVKKWGHASLVLYVVGCLVVVPYTDCLVWTRDKHKIILTFNVDPIRRQK